MDNYKKINIIGRGTYANVYKAKSKSDNNLIAIKKMLNPDYSVEGIRASSVREIMTLRSCDHKNILKIIDAIYDKRCIKMIVELFEYDLKKCIKDNLMTDDQSLDCIFQIVDGIKYLHIHGFMHRDLKPQNILVKKVGKTLNVTLADFGLTRRYYNQLIPQVHTCEVATLWYRAPELILGMRKYTESIDIWSLGLVIGELLLKKPLLPGNCEIDQLYKTFRLLGTPTELEWNDVETLPYYQKDVFPKWKPNFDEQIKCENDKQMRIKDLIRYILILDPSKRPDIFDIYRHSIFDNFEKEFEETNDKVSKLISNMNLSIRHYRCMLNVENCISGNYLEIHTDLTQNMIMILLDWIIDVSLKFKLLSNTLFRTIQLIYIFLEKTNTPINRKELQLVGIACMLLASKLEEMYSIEVRDFIYICDSAYNEDELLDTEFKILDQVKYLSNPMPIEFLRVYDGIFEHSAEKHTLTKMILEHALFSKKLITYNPSTLAMCISYMSTQRYTLNSEQENKCYHEQNNIKDDFKTITNFSYSDIEESECFKELVEWTKNLYKDDWKYTAVKRKYSVRYFGVAKLKFIDDDSKFLESQKS